MSVKPAQALRDYTLFFGQFWRNLRQSGAILPSSSALARAMTSYLARKQGQVRVLEVGAGTGALTAGIVPLLRPGDALDIVEINPKLMAHLQWKFQHLPQFRADGVAVRFINDDVRKIAFEHKYDYIIFSLPLTNFPPGMVQELLDLMMSCLKPGGVFSYVRYIFISRLKSLFGGSRLRAELRANRAIMNTFARKYQIERRAVWRNVPPAWAFFWQKR